MPKVYTRRQSKADIISIAVATSCTKAADSIDYKYFVLDSSLEPVVRAMAFRAGQCKLQLTNVDGEVIATDRFTPVEKIEWQDAFFGSVITRKELGYNGIERTITNIFLAPVFGRMEPITSDHERQNSRTLEKVKTTITIPRTLTLSLDELRSVKDAKVEITFDE